MLRYDAGEGRRSTTLSVGVAIDSILRVRIIYYLCSGLPPSYFIFENLKILQYSPEHPTDSGAVTQLDKAEALNNQFFTFFTDENILSPNLEPSFPLIGDLSFTAEGIENILNNLSTDKSPGPDNIPNFILKLSSSIIAPVLQVIFTQSLNDQMLPNDWLSANIVPVHKKGKKNLASNYRPISLTSTCCKVMEHIIFHFIMDHLSSNDIISKHQHGFRPSHSCQSQLLLLTDDILKAMDNKKQIDLIFLDFCKAFDKVPHRRLLNKLKYYGITGELVKWIEQWLTKRNQRVTLENHVSSKLPVKSGVPQGTVLGPLMFLLYINDIDESISSMVRLFADDCVIYRIIESLEDSLCLQRDLNTILDWTRKWQMQLNIDKCVVLRCTRSLFPITLDYKSDDISLKVVKQYKYLGIILHEGMRWLHHIQSICNKANKSLNFLRRNLSKCSINVKENAYLTIVRPLLEYAACVWDPYQEYLIYDLEKIQRRAARWVLSNYNYYSSVTDMLKTLKWPTLQERRNISRLSQLHKIVHQLTPSIQLPSCFLTKQYPTRQLHQHRFIIPFSSTVMYQKSFFPNTLKQWNTLPDYILEEQSTDTFINYIK